MLVSLTRREAPCLLHIFFNCSRTLLGAIRHLTVFDLKAMVKSESIKPVPDLNAFVPRILGGNTVGSRTCAVQYSSEPFRNLKCGEREIRGNGVSKCAKKAQIIVSLPFRPRKELPAQVSQDSYRNLSPFREMRLGWMGAEAWRIQDLVVEFREEIFVVDNCEISVNLQGHRFQVHSDYFKITITAFGGSIMPRRPRQYY